MLCLICGREVEFNGNVCPWCGTQKVQSQVTHGQWAAPSPESPMGASSISFSAPQGFASRSYIIPFGIGR